MPNKTMKLQVKPEGREDIYLPIDKDNLKQFIKSRELKHIHNFIPSGMMMIGADHELKSVLSDIDNAERIAIFTYPNANMGYSLALISNNKLECYDVGNITDKDLDVKE